MVSEQRKVGPLGLQAAIAAWREIVGSENVTDERSTLSRFEHATFKTDRKIAAVVWLSSRAHVEACLRIANETRTAVYPISCGKNWGLGSKLPTADGCVLLDLSRMNRVVDFSEDLSYITVEPGVTFAQATDYLRQQQSRCYLAVIGGPPGASLIGNAIERGDGVGPYGDRFLYCCALEVVLATGEVVHTGFARFPNAVSAKVHRWGVGPSVDGIFSQSNLGVVTQATFWLALRPPRFQSFLFTLSGDRELPDVCDAIRRLMALRLIQPNSLALWNDFKFVAANTQYPWDITTDHVPLLRQQLHSLKTPFRGARWVGIGALYSATRKHEKADKKLLRAELRSTVGRLLFMDSMIARIAHLLKAPLRRVAGIDVVSLLRALYHEPIFLGFPTHQSVHSTYWRKRTAVPADPDPDRDHCGVLWLCPAVPFESNRIVEALTIIEETFLRHRFEPNIAITFPSERCVYVLPSILFDRSSAEEDTRALRCHDEMLASLIEAGYYPHRLGVQSMGALPDPGGGSSVIVRRIKEALDPDGILAPGRYSQGEREDGG